jgi:hypothetical protein
MGKGDGGPPIFNLVVGKPRVGLKVYNPKPIFNQIPNADGVATFEEYMTSRFVLVATKRANSTIGPPASRKPITSPKSVLDHEPRKNLAFWGSPNLPNHVVHARANGPLKLPVVSRGACVYSISGEFPNDSVRDVIV